MFFQFPYWQAGFSGEEWDEMPRGDKVLTRDYYLNGRDFDQTWMFDEYEGPYQMYRLRARYNIEERPDVKIKLSDCNFVA